MLFKNEKPKHITFALKDFSKRLPIVDEFNDDDNKESFVFKSTNLSRKIRLKPINHNGIINVKIHLFRMMIMILIYLSLEIELL